MKTAAIIVAAGNSIRFGSGIPKQYNKLGSVTVIEHTIQQFLDNRDIDYVLVVISKEHQDLYSKSVKGHKKLLDYVYGGDTRQKSVFAGLKRLAELKVENVLIHDAARPFVTDDIILKTIDALRAVKAVDVAVDITDTIKFKESFELVDRDALYATQTPQAFDFKTIYSLHQQYQSQNFTDDISLAKKAGLEIALVEGYKMNFKITTQDDLIMANNMIAKTYVTKIGMGFDVHEIEASVSGKVPVCGINIECGYKVIAHSDGDVGLHALVDALLGAIGAGDIGHHFPPSDEKWKGCDSLVFLKHAYQLVKAEGGLISNIDITILCETPKVNPHKEEMISKIAQALEINKKTINVKATTTEKLGFLGRKEGIAANAVASVRFEELG
ncbi:MAG: bifunctional 2-C-methyl-D-erythritol 4-phosphate cytidylyltransferase/2-C-methyl-D-erythritol 2,4-cyclodiphosphate synthase [Alphaproteobacteria bacterium]|jgi:2-C-methyl-D-erythritol 4-phosphate cytidylyltransferase/2-C-methyl-D-erythritol 2,4-cyclodiphosphate synthase|nr:bifunctional 2-C-methyl-D-erythritol 4-phosphate cytidylyltransferase/2-C-methyl-D-erythritol 2,4-cyclodiphosphate synthase [Candidatus Jidaibacter sp.]